MSCTTLTCPDAYHRIDPERLVRHAVEPVQRLSLSGLYLAGWVLAPLALWRRPVLGGLALAGAAAAALLALGPCPTFGDRPFFTGIYAHDPTSPTWCRLDLLTDYGRGGAAAGLVLAMLSGVGVGAIADGGRLRQGLAIVFGLFTVGAAGSVHMAELQDPERFHRPRAPATDAFLASAAPGPVAELPFDRQAQFSSALAHPARPRLNPLKAQPRPGETDPVVLWLQGLGMGRAAATPTAEELALSDIRWVVWDPSRCTGQNRAACAPDVRATLGAALGQPVWSHQQARAWAVGTPDAEPPEAPSNEVHFTPK